MHLMTSLHKNETRRYCSKSSQSPEYDLNNFLPDIGLRLSPDRPVPVLRSLPLGKAVGLDFINTEF